MQPINKVRGGTPGSCYQAQVEKASQKKDKPELNFCTPIQQGGPGRRLFWQIRVT